METRGVSGYRNWTLFLKIIFKMALFSRFVIRKQIYDASSPNVVAYSSSNVSLNDVRAKALIMVEKS